MKARQPISRVLSFKLVIYLGLNSHLTSSNQPRWLTKNCFWPKISLAISIWSCSRWGFPCVFCYQKNRCALTAPFHPCLDKAVYFLWHYPWGLPRQKLSGTAFFRARTFLHCVFYYTKATNQLSGDIRIMKKTTLNQEFFKTFLLNY